MAKLIFILAILLPSATFGQVFDGSYRAIFVDLLSERKMIVAEFSVSAEGTLGGILRINDSEKAFNGTVEKTGKFEAVIEQGGNFTFKLKGKFDRDNKISLVQMEQTGSGLNRRVSEKAVEGKFFKVESTLPETGPSIATGTDAELSNTGKSLLKLAHSEALFGTTWADFIAVIRFERSNRPRPDSGSIQDTGTNEPRDILVVNVRSKIDGQQTLMFNIAAYAPGKKSWRQNELRAATYREVKGEQRNSFLTGATFQTDPRYANGRVEIVEENESQIVLKLTNFKIKRLNKEEFVTLDGFIYADR
ncbi:MAG TPA: hypothetical protein PLK77_04415 [Pyrinomonadaceae bacterium]|nr:hypothetical protein [Pyrinomonadaceae bacterium]